MEPTYAAQLYSFVGTRVQHKPEIAHPNRVDYHATSKSFTGFCFTMDVIDTGLRCLGTIAQFHQLPVDEGQLANQFGVPGVAFNLETSVGRQKAV